MSLVVIFLFYPYSNFFQRVTDVNWMNYLSKFTYMKYNINGLIISIYGLGRCMEGQTVKAYHEYGISGDHELNDIFIGLACIFSILIAVECIIINVRLMDFNIFCKLNIFQSVQDDIIDQKASITITENSLHDDNINNNVNTQTNNDSMD